jgi:hypothetical protein
MQDLTLYYLFLKCNLMHYYFDKILLFAKSGCYRHTPLKGISPTRFRKRLGIIRDNLLLVLIHAPTLPHLPRGDSTVLCTSLLPDCESVALRYPRSWLAFRYRLNLLQGQDIPLVVAPLALVSTSSAVIHETHHVRPITEVVAQVDKPLLPYGQWSWMARHILGSTSLWPWICRYLS